MAYENLKKLLEEWKKYATNACSIPSRICNKERNSIARAVKNEVRCLKQNNEYYKVLPEEEKIINEINNFIEKGVVD